MLENKKPTQCEKVLAYMKKYGSITTFEAFLDLGILRLGARISEMRKRGLNIKDETICVKNRDDEKCHISKYYLGDE